MSDVLNASMDEIQADYPSVPAGELTFDTLESDVPPHLRVAAAIRNVEPAQASPEYEDAAFAHDPQAIGYYREHGCTTVDHAYTLANILHTNRCVAEAAAFYRVAFDLHSKSPTHYPLAQSLLQTRLLCLLKAGAVPDQEEVDALRRLNAAHAAYIDGITRAWRGGDPSGALDIMGTCYEEFHTGEEADALYLETALRSGEPFFTAAQGRTASAPAIPRRLYMYWDHNPPPEVEANFAYHQNCAGFELKVFNREEAANWLYDAYGIEARTIFLNARHPAEAADILRVHVIHMLGGWWLDADIRIRNPEEFARLASGPYDQIFFTTDNNYIHNDFFGSAPSTPFLADCLLSLYRNCYLHGWLFIAYKTGPGVFNRAMNRAIFNYRRGMRPMAPTRMDDHLAFWDYIEDFDTPYKAALRSWQTA